MSMSRVQIILRHILENMSAELIKKIYELRKKIANQTDTDDDYLGLERAENELNALLAALQEGTPTGIKAVDDLVVECDRYTPDIIWWEIIIWLIIWAKERDAKKANILAEIIRENIEREQEYDR